jgi:hypothetical protein
MTSFDVELCIQNGSKYCARPRDFINVVHDSFRGMKKPCIFIDSEFGEWRATPHHVIRGNCHPKRFFKSLFSTPEEINEKIQKGTKKVPPRPFLRMVPGTYTSAKDKALFVDDEFGEFTATVGFVLSGQNHRNRLVRDKIKSSLKNFLNRLQSLNKPYIKVIEESYFGMAKKATFVDEKYGCWITTPTHILRGYEHPKRKHNWDSKELELEIRKTRPWISLDHSTYKSSREKARFIDKDLGEWWVKPQDLLDKRRNSNHPRRYLEKLLLSSEEIEHRIHRGYNGIPPRPYIKLKRETYISTSERATFIDEEFGEWETYVYVVLHGSGHPLRFNKYPGLETIFSELFSIPLYSKIPSPFRDDGINIRPDFEIVPNLLYVDVDGLYWHSEKRKNDKYHHQKRRRLFEEKGLRLIQFRENEVRKKPEIIKSIISHLTNKSNTIYARKCTSNLEKNRSFWEENHLMGYASGRQINLALNKEIVCSLLYQIRGKELHIIRFCNKNYVNVVGGFSKLLEFAVSSNNFKGEVINFVDLRYGTGKFLEKIGFTKTKETLGWQWTDGENVYNRLKCRANMDKRKLTERQHAEELGWYKIYDAGQAKFTKKV